MASIKYKTEDGYVSIPMSIEAKTNEENGNGIGTCSTSSGTALEVVLNNYNLAQNGFVAVTFEHDVPANATLNINSKGAKPIYYKGSAITADTIKADDTVMFCYNGSQYVVTSLGGGGGSSVYPEFVTIHLTSTEGDGDTNLIGATVVVTDDDTSDTLLSTTWQGSDIALQVDAETDYTVTVGNVTDYVLKSNTQSYTAISGLSRTVKFEYIGDGVNLGLPSGTIWCTHNVGASQPQEYGLYFSYGNGEGHNRNAPASPDYSFTSTNYNSTVGATLNASFVSGSRTYDGARNVMGGNWRTPTDAEFSELLTNCTAEEYTISDELGIRFTSRINGNTIFFPLAGAFQGTTLSYDDIRGYYNTNGLSNDTTRSNIVAMKNGGAYTVQDGPRYEGRSIRAVY